MPDDQFATDVKLKPIGVSFATATREERVPFSVEDTPRAPVSPVPVGSYPDDLTQEQELQIQAVYEQVLLEETIGENAVDSGAYRVSKRALDILVALPALVLLSPIMLMVAIAIRLDSSGPALFRQQRVGQHGKLFCIYKFRSMTVNAGVQLNGTHKNENDSRVTRVGRFIRKTSLDELPQLYNVLLGQMSLVGPRPELPEIMLQRYEPWQYRRLSVPQGITGWWQVTGRGKKLLWKHTADDLYYVDRASFAFDLKLLIMTIGVVLGRDGAF